MKKILRIIAAPFVFAFKSLATVAYVILAVTITVLSGCESMTPTRTPPLAKAMGYEIPNFHGWSTVGINSTMYEIEHQKLLFLGTMVEMVNAPALLAREKAIDWFNVGMAAGVFGGLPLAFRRVPPGAVKKEEHEKEVMRAGLQDPEAFIKKV